MNRSCSCKAGLVVVAVARRGWWWVQQLLEEVEDDEQDGGELEAEADVVRSGYVTVQTRSVSV